MSVTDGRIPALAFIPSGQRRVLRLRPSRRVDSGGHGDIACLKALLITAGTYFLYRLNA
jgi:hypothetical protein